MDFDELNKFYFRLRTKCAALFHGLYHRVFQLEWGWFDGHYARGADGTYHMSSYPIPVISVKGFCDIEINPDSVTVSAKRKRQDVLEGSFEKLARYPFEAYGVENYTEDYYLEGMTLDDLRENVKKSGETEIGFSFRFDFDVTGEQMYEFAKLLRRENFYY